MERRQRGLGRLARFGREGAIAGFAIALAFWHTGARPVAAAPPAAPSGPVISVATFYAGPFQGKPMANGQRYDMNDPTTTASNLWPLGTRLRVRRIPGSPYDAKLTLAERNRVMGRWIEVVVRDRGAFAHAVDLSKAAFALLGSPSEGVIRVQVQAVTGK